MQEIIQNITVNELLASRLHFLAMERSLVSFDWQDRVHIFSRMRYTGLENKSNDTYVCRYSNARSVLVFKAYIYVNIYAEVLRLLSRFKNC